MNKGSDISAGKKVSANGLNIINAPAKTMAVIGMHSRKNQVIATPVARARNATFNINALLWSTRTCPVNDKAKGKSGGYCLDCNMVQATCRCSFRPDSHSAYQANQVSSQSNPRGDGGNTIHTPSRKNPVTRARIIRLVFR